MSPTFVKDAERNEFSVPETDWPEPLRGDDNSMRRWLLLRHANHLAEFYGGPVYLVGSALRKPNPRDYDIVVIIPDTDFFHRYGLTPKDWEKEGASGLYENRWRWAADMIKQTRRAWSHTMENVDLKIIPEWSEAARWAKEPKFRLDTRP